MSGITTVMEFPWEDGFEVGQGFDIHQGISLGAAGFSQKEAKLSPNPRPHMTDDYRLIQDQNSFSAAMEAAASLSGKGWGYSASLSASGSSLSKTSEMSLSVFVYGYQENGSMQIDPVTQTLDFGGLEVGGAAFREKYGTHFIAGYVTGGKFTGLYRRSYKSVEEKKAMQVHFKGAYKKGVSAKASADFNASETSLNFSSETDLFIDADQSSDGKPADPRKVGSVKAFLVEYDNFKKNRLKLNNKIKAIVMPWSVLNAFSKEMKHNNLGQIEGLPTYLQKSDYIAQSIDMMLTTYTQLQHKHELETLRNQIRETKLDVISMVGDVISGSLTGKKLATKIQLSEDTSVDQFNRYFSLTRLFMEFQLNFNLFMDEAKTLYQIKTSKKIGPVFPKNKPEWAAQKMYNVRGLTEVKLNEEIPVLTIPDAYGNSDWQFGVYARLNAEGNLGMSVYIIMANKVGHENRVSSITSPYPDSRSSDWTPWFASQDFPPTWNVGANQLAIRGRLVTKKPEDVSDGEWKDWTNPTPD